MQNKSKAAEEMSEKEDHHERRRNREEASDFAPLNAISLERTADEVREGVVSRVLIWNGAGDPNRFKEGGGQRHMLRRDRV